MCFETEAIELGQKEDSERIEWQPMLKQRRRKEETKNPGSLRAYSHSGAFLDHGTMGKRFTDTEILFFVIAVAA